MKTQDTTIRASLLFLAAFAAVTALYFTRHLMAPFALAIFIWLIIDAFARFLDRLSPKFPYWLALTIAVLTVVAAIVGIVFIIADTAAGLVDQAPKYQGRLSEIFAWVGNLTGQDVSFGSLNERFGLTDKVEAGLAGFAASIQGVLSDFMVIAIYVAFLFAAQSSFPKKMDDLFPNADRRAQARKVGERIRHSIEKYLGVQTVISLMQTVISFIGMTALGLDNALFWALVIFILNYIPIVGGLAAVALPCMFALVQFDSGGKIALLAGILFGAQFIIGNTIQPKMMGDSMNLSALVVVLSLTLWGALWGGVGAFLSAPLTVIIMIILAQFDTTRWIAVLLSADGHPDMDEDEKKRSTVTPSM
ncbi:AI-2E family transporter [Litorimonas sp. RW-G-Af-16]|uniref:AI-2E family transporter n=1 Tax=Litorimonas sp. RW-G-Af-16 TaxID=3241168 RepID=UPI00390C9894